MSKEQNFPPGWNQDRVNQVLAHYETQSESEAIAEDEAAFEQQDESIMRVPLDLIPTVRELIGKHQAQQDS